MSFSEEFKRVAVEKFLNRGNRKVEELCKELGTSSNSVYYWMKKYGKFPSTMKKQSKDLTSKEKIELVIAYFALDEAERGGWLRQHGLHSHQIEQWQKQMAQGLESKKDPERANDKQKIKELERQLARKEKALAEAAALLVLKKKADALWGSEEDE